MARIAGVDLPRNKRIEIGLTYILGIGRSSSNRILGKLNIDPNQKTDDLSESGFQGRYAIGRRHFRPAKRRDIAQSSRSLIRKRGTEEIAERRSTAKKRRRDRALPLEADALAYWDDGHTDLLALDEILEQLGERDEELLRIVELRFFGGLTLEETAAMMGMSVRQVHRRWTFARGWLRRTLEAGGGHG